MPPCTSFVDLLLVPLAKSAFSIRATVYPRAAASSATPAPVIPPPITRTSKWPLSSSWRLHARTVAENGCMVFRKESGPRPQGRTVAAHGLLSSSFPHMQNCPEGHNLRAANLPEHSILRRCAGHDNRCDQYAIDKGARVNPPGLMEEVGGDGRDNYIHWHKLVRDDGEQGLVRGRERLTGSQGNILDEEENNIA